MLSKSPNQYGQTKTGINIEERNVSIYGALVSNCAEEEEVYRKRLVKALNPLLKGSIEIRATTYEKMASNVQITEGVTFEDKEYEELGHILFFSFSLIVPSNFLEDLVLNEISMQQIIPKLVFPIVFNLQLLWGIYPVAM